MILLGDVRMSWRREPGVHSEVMKARTWPVPVGEEGVGVCALHYLAIPCQKLGPGSEDQHPGGDTWRQKDSSIQDSEDSARFPVTGLGSGQRG